MGAFDIHSTYSTTLCLSCMEHQARVAQTHILYNQLSGIISDKHEVIITGEHIFRLYLLVLQRDHSMPHTPGWVRFLTVVLLFFTLLVRFWFFFQPESRHTVCKITHVQLVQLLFTVSKVFEAAGLYSLSTGGQISAQACFLFWLKQWIVSYCGLYCLWLWDISKSRVQRKYLFWFFFFDGRKKNKLVNTWPLRYIP